MALDGVMGRSRRAALLAVAVVAPFLPLHVAPVATASAAAASAAEPGCTSEQAGLLELPCDDSTPPDTVVTSVAPAPNAGGWTRQDSMTIHFAAVAPDEQPGSLVTQCRLTGPSQAHDWRACTSPVTYPGLADTTPPGYRFEVRAVDAPDHGILLAWPMTDTPDLDASPATFTWGQDTVVPREFLTVDIYDELTPEDPVLRGPGLVAKLNASEPGVSVECTDNGAPLPCAPGRNVFTGLPAGDHDLTMRVTDPAGNTSGWADEVRFTVPADLARRAGWKQVRSAAHVGGDVLVSKRPGARLVVRTKVVRELRLYADSSRRAGTLRVRVGKGAWQPVRLAGKRERGREVVVFGPWDGVRRGKVQIETVGRRPVRVDAIVVR